MTPTADLLAIARSAAARYGLKPELVCAVIEQESGWSTYAIRYEDEFYNKYCFPLFLQPGITATEARARAFSWGLMQVMGEVARELGWAGDLPGLTAPLNGVEYGCKKLAHVIELASGDEQKGLDLYNGERTAFVGDYGSQVLARVKNYA